MSMITEYARLRPDELAQFRQLLAEDPAEAFQYVEDLRSGDEDEEVSSRGMDTDKAWAGLQYLLDKVGAPVDVISGGEPITDEEWGYDAPRLLTVEEVSTASHFLNATPFALLARHYVPADFKSADVYPGMWDEDDALSYLEGYYFDLVRLFHAAATDREPILVWMG
jgi:hypothetical protein